MRGNKNTARDAAPFCRAITWVRFGARDLPVFPWLAVKYFLYFVLTVVAIMGATELWLSRLSVKRVVVSNEWTLENSRINAMNGEKVAAATPRDPVWRSRGIPPPPPNGAKYRILILGDSFVWGDGYANANDIWWRQLDRELKHRGYREVEVVAAGLNGASTQEQLRWLRDLPLLDQVKPDLVIVGYVTNDPDVLSPVGEPYVKQIGREVAIPTWARLDRTLGRVVPTLVAQLKPRLTEKWASRVEGAYAYADWELKLLESPNIEAYGEVLRELGTVLRSRSLPVLFVTLPNYPSREYHEPRYRPVKPLFQEAGLAFYDLLGDFVQEYPMTAGGVSRSVLHWGINPANSHPGPESTRFYARKVVDILERQHAELLEPQSPAPRDVRPRINDWMPPNLGVRSLSSDEWLLSLPPAGAALPRLPMGEPHVILAFDTPAAIRAVVLEGADLREAKLWFTSVDAETGVERQDPIAVEPGLPLDHGLQWSLERLPQHGHVNTLKLQASVDSPPPDRRVELDRQTLRHRGGNAYFFVVPELQQEADDPEHLSRSPWVLLEDGVPLGPPHTSHSEIETHGNGLWSHWKYAVIFSTSDNSNPRSNGRRYELVTYAPGGPTVKLRIEFDDTPARP
jgi:lysophospholipase L1-like esterase